MKRWAAMVGVALLLVAHPAAADGVDQEAFSHGTADGATVGVASHHGAAGGSHHDRGNVGSSPYESCRPAGMLGTGVGITMYRLQGKPIPVGPNVVWMACLLKGAGGVEFLPVDRTPQLRQLAVAAAEAQLRIDVPDVAAAPPLGGLQLVGVPVWFWNRDGSARSATAAIPALSATVTAAIAGLEVRAGAERSSCAGAGRAWATGMEHPAEGTDCAHTFQDAGSVTVTVTQVWHLHWSTSDHGSGTLPDLRRSRRVTLAVHEAQAVTD